VLVIPFLIWAFAKLNGMVISLPHLVNLVGYSLFVYIPASVSVCGLGWQSWLGNLMFLCGYVLRFDLVALCYPRRTSGLGVHWISDDFCSSLCFV
jgi:hypothetical protein